ncbi:glycoside hydrolase family 27 protein [Phenylobacterium montanum]|uniref:glycoside hydrolase family 27 protein n=1 Tax=Phenylobacterium montanum TaxID=2823693 RepID=UPI002011F426|nr:glycoside hydrolase family 27 protein [Caulobacter sp. S6]
MTRFLAWMAALILTAAAAPTLAQVQAPPTPNGLAATPPMGWNSWNRFGCDINEDVIRKAADAMVASGMKDAGYQYVVIDDCWHGARDAHGDIQPDPQRFPSGIKALADYVHAKGLKFGIYSDAGSRTCAGRPGSRGYEYQDAKQYAAWGVDYLKYDWCNTSTEDAREAYSTMADALHQTGRPIVFSLCEWGTAKPWLWAGRVGNLWRTTPDIYDAWQGVKGTSFGMLNILDGQAGIDSYAGPGHWNDPDMLEVGNGGMTADEYRAHFSLWAMLAAPLIAGNDLASMNEETRAILTNREVIAVDQDPLGVEGKRILRDGSAEVWARPLKGGGRAVVLLNRGKAAQHISVAWEALGYPAKMKAEVRDLWAGKSLGKLTGAFSADVPSHAAVMVRIEGS